MFFVFCIDEGEETPVCSNRYFHQTHSDASYDESTAWKVVKYQEKALLNDATFEQILQKNMLFYFSNFMNSENEGNSVAFDTKY